MTWCSKMFGFDKATEEERLVQRDPMVMSAREMMDTFYHPDRYLPRPSAERRILELLVGLSQETSDLRQRVGWLEAEISRLNRELKD